MGPFQDSFRLYFSTLATCTEAFLPQHHIIRKVRHAEHVPNGGVPRGRHALLLELLDMDRKAYRGTCGQSFLVDCLVLFPTVDEAILS